MIWHRTVHDPSGIEMSWTGRGIIQQDRVMIGHKRGYDRTGQNKMRQNRTRQGRTACQGKGGAGHGWQQDRRESKQNQIKQIKFRNRVT